MTVSARELLQPSELVRLENYALMAKAAVEGFLSGLHRSLFHGTGTEFLQYRNYVPGEDLKYLDWKVYARRDRLYTKVFQEETTMNIYFIVDASGSHDYRGSRAACSKLTYACMTAAALAYLASRQGDNIALYAYNDQMREAVEPGHRTGHLSRILHALTRLKPIGPAAHDKVLRAVVPQMHQRGIVVFISDMLEAEETLPPLLRQLRFAHCDTIALQILDPDELDLPHERAVRYLDAEMPEAEVTTHAPAIRADYKLGMDAFLETLANNLKGAQVDYLRLLTNESLGTSLARYLHKREALR
ncbi:MAG: DUF58 domain-containing protein [Opitutales bacterium]|nr:DUF58 domain-containing protein [Opitutales bacterium]